MARFCSKAKNEIHRLHHDLYDVQNASNRRVISQEVTARLQADLERARREIEQLTTEKESLAAKYKVKLHLLANKVRFSLTRSTEAWF